jgi:hypothetical protein
MLIAVHALNLQATLVTNNLAVFERVPGLQLDNWVPTLWPLPAWPETVNRNCAIQRPRIDSSVAGAAAG